MYLMHIAQVEGYELPALFAAAVSVPVLVLEVFMFWGWCAPLRAIHVDLR